MGSDSVSIVNRFLLWSCRTKDHIRRNRWGNWGWRGARVCVRETESKDKRESVFILNVCGRKRLILKEIESEGTEKEWKGYREEKKAKSNQQENRKTSGRNTEREMRGGQGKWEEVEEKVSESMSQNFITFASMETARPSQVEFTVCICVCVSCSLM